MFITTENEIVSLMPTSRWSRPDQLKGWLEEEERVALEPLLGTSLYAHLCREYERLRNIYGDITATTVKPTRKARLDPGQPYADVTERLDAIASKNPPHMHPAFPADDEEGDVPETDMQAIRLIRICQQIEFYLMLAHKAGMLTVSFNEGGGANRVSAEGYDPADDKEIDRLTKDSFMAAERATDSLLLFLEADAKGERQFTEKWQEADAFYLNRDLLFQTASVMQKFSTVRFRMDYVDMVHDIRFCQNTYLKPRVGARLLKAVVDFANGEATAEPHANPDTPLVMTELLEMLRMALGFYVECRRTELGPKKERLARRDSMTNAQQAMAMACDYIADHLDDLGEAAVDSPAWKTREEARRQQQWNQEHRQQAEERRRREASEQGRRKLFTAFPATHRTPELK